MPRRFRPAVVAAATCVVVVAPPARAQAGGAQPVRSQRADAAVAVPSGIVRGEVLDAATAQPLAGATVVLTPASPTAALPSRGRSPFVSAARSTKTDDDGRYRFTDIVPGQYRLHVQRLGYQAASLELALEGAPESRVSVGLEIAPVRLAAMRVEEPAADPATLELRSARLTDTDSARLAAAHARQAAFLSADVREITRGEVRDAVTLGDSDLLRALQRLPGVSTRNEQTAELWVRGARWDMTRISFDGVPLFAPFHAGAFSGVGADAIGAALLFPGVRPASLDGGAAAHLDLRSRSGGGDGSLRGVGGVDQVSAAFTLDQRRADGRAAWLVSARRTYAELFGNRRVPFTPGQFSPRYFGDVTTRLDLALGARSRIEVSGLLSGDAEDREWATLAPELIRDDATTVGAAGRISLISSASTVEVRHTIGASRADYSRIQQITDDVGMGPQDGRLQTDASLDYAFVEGIFASVARTGGVSTWRLGYSLARHDAKNHRDLAVTPDTGAVRSSYRFSERDRFDVGSVWLDRRWQPMARLLVSTGLRVDASGPLLNAASVRPMPRIEARFHADARTSVSLAVGRHWQYVQSLSHTFGEDPHRTETVQPEAQRLLAGAELPAVRADIVSLGAERWVGNYLLLSGSIYARSSAGLLVRHDVLPTGGSVPGLDDLIADERAHGVDLGIRKLAGATTGQIAYSFARSTVTANGLRYAATPDRRHVLDATARRTITKRLGISTAFAFATGAPYTRMSPLDAQPGESAASDVPSTNGARDVDFRSLDLAADWSLRVGPIDGTAFVQLRNVLGTKNSTGYAFSRSACAVTVGPNTDVCRDGNYFLPGRSMFPLVGLRFRF